MNPRHSNPSLRGIFIALIVTIVIGVVGSARCSDEPKSEATLPKTDSGTSKTNSVQSKVISPSSKQAPPKKQLTGAELYSMHCNRCHPERYPTERTSAQWKTIMLHMRVRANLPADQSRLILKYLQENSGR